MSGILVLPKVRKTDGHIVVTSIDTDMIKGCEPRQVKINNKMYPGTKIYTDNGHTFYVLAAPNMVTAAKAVAAKTQNLIAVPAVFEIKAYENEVKQIMTMQEKLAISAKSSAE